MTIETMETMAMKNAYTEVIETFGFEQHVVEAAIADEEVIENFIKMYNENEYNFVVIEHHSLAENMKNFLFYANDVDMGGVIENVSLLLENI